MGAFTRPKTKKEDLEEHLLLVANYIFWLLLIGLGIRLFYLR